MSQQQTLADQLRKITSLQQKPSVDVTSIAPQDTQTFDEDELVEVAPVVEETTEQFAADENSVDEEQGEQLYIPECFVIPQTAGTQFTLELYSKKCLDCVSFGTGETVHTVCHFEHGKNPSCPAREINVVFVGQTRKIATRLQKALEDGDDEKVDSIFNRLTTQGTTSVADVIKELMKQQQKSGS